jgi:hypothetical protein
MPWQTNRGAGQTARPRSYIDGAYPNLRGRIERDEPRQIETSTPPRGKMVITVPGR